MYLDICILETRYKFRLLCW